MNHFYADRHVTLYNGDCRSMAELPDGSVQCVVTSPPYWGLRKYAGQQDLIWGGDKECRHDWVERKIYWDNRHAAALAVGIKDGMGGKSNARKKEIVADFCSLCGAWRGAFGLEPTPELYVRHTVEILREIKRVLRKDGVVFWNIGDSYMNSPSNQQSGVGQRYKNIASREKRIKSGFLKPKDLCLIPFRVAIAAQEDGWWVRSVIIWNKNNPMPESVTDRPTESHEYILMLTKSARYYWDAEAVKESQITLIGDKANHTFGAKGGKAIQVYGESGIVSGEKWNNTGNGRNLRSVWTFPTQPYPEAHFATFPEALPERCIKAATPEAGCCPECGAPWTRVIEKGLTAHDSKTKGGKDSNANRIALLRQAARERGSEYVNQTQTLGWRPTCRCETDKPPVPSLVLDPFAGSGTTLWVAKKLNRRAVGYEISEEYCRLIVERNRQQVIL